MKSVITGYDNKRIVLLQYKGKGMGGFFMQIFSFSFCVL